MLKPKELQS